VDALNRFIQRRDEAYSDRKILDRIPRKTVARRVCSACWRTMLRLPDLRVCPHCGGKLHEVVL
jgi:predicted amidophosphoribosyltransferase